jgi:type III secretory pathway component EscV
MLDEIPLVVGSVQLGQRFCPDAARCRVLGIPFSETRQRSDSAEGAWLAAESWPAAEAAGLTLWEPFHFVFHELATLIRRNAASFLGVQELENLLETWTRDSKDIALRDRALPDHEARIRFLQMLRALLEEEVSIARLSTLLTIFAEQNPRCSELSEIVEHARRALRAELPGNDLGRNPVALSPAFEAEVARWVQTLDGRSFLAMPPETAQALLAAFRTAHDGAADQIVVVRDVRLRPFVRRLLVVEFPLVPVLSWPERVDDALAPALEVQFSPAPAETVSQPAN